MVKSLQYIGPRAEMNSSSNAIDGVLRNDGNELSPEMWEILNAHGPYSHGIWIGNDVEVGNEETHRGRGLFLTDRVRAAILEQFTTEEQLRSMTLLDLGCYDGWTTCRFEDLPLKKIICFTEGRQKNER